MEIGKPDPFGRQLVDMRRLDFRCAVTADIRVAHVVHQDENHVWTQRCFFLLPQKVESLQRRDNLWVVNKQLQTPLLIGAGGFFCPVAKFLGSRTEQTKSIVTAQEVEFEATENQLQHSQVDAEIPELFFCHDFLTSN